MRLTKYIKHSWNSIYNFYKKSEMEIKKRKSRISLKSQKSKSSVRSSKSVQEWLLKIAKPKKIHPPDPLPVKRDNLLQLS